MEEAKRRKDEEIQKRKMEEEIEERRIKREREELEEQYKREEEGKRRKHEEVKKANEVILANKRTPQRTNDNEFVMAEPVKHRGGLMSNTFNDPFLNVPG